jgi:hypothetical protein
LGDLALETSAAQAGLPTIVCVGAAFAPAMRAQVVETSLKIA